MAGNFVGMLIELTLKSPSDATILGRVASIDGNSLELRDVFFPKLQQTLPTYSVPSVAIADLQIIETQPRLPTADSLTAPESQFSVVDPAILSYSGPGPEVSQHHPPANTIGRLQHSPVELSNAPASAQVPHNGAFDGSTRAIKQRIEKNSSSPTSIPTQAKTDLGPQTTARRKAPNSKSKKKSAQTISELQADENGWGSEDASGIQDLPEFDFAANLSKFDKRSVFEQIRNEDTTAEEDRLVSHNRLRKARPGTYGGKNLHPTENVLTSGTTQAHEQSRVRPESETAITHVLNETPSFVDSTGVGTGRSTYVNQRPLVSPPSTAHRNASSRNSHRDPSSRTESVMSAHTKFTTDFHPRLITRSSGLSCPTYEARFLRHGVLEANVPGVNGETMTEFCARGIAQMIATTISRQPAPSRRSSRTSLHTNITNHKRVTAQPVVVTVVGNHSRGAQTIAAMRHLYGRGYRILLSVADFQQPRQHCASVSEQLQNLRVLGKKAARIDGWHGISSQVKQLNSPPSLIVDALLDGTTYNSIRDASFALEVRETIDWVNRSRAPVLSVECPSGYDAATAETTILEGEPLAVIPDRVLALGAPVHGLVEAAKDGEAWTEHISCVDVGIQPALGPDGLVPFGLDEWTVDLQYEKEAERWA